MTNIVKRIWFLVGAFCIYQMIVQVSTKLYRIERYSMYNCDKAKKNELIIFNKATMRIYGGNDKLVFDGYFEILQDIQEEIWVKLGL
jgi:hypothetical protein